MNINITVDNLDTINSRKMHELTIISLSTIQLLHHLKLLPTTGKNGDPCPKGCNDWCMGTGKDRILIYNYFDLISLLY